MAVSSTGSSAASNIYSSLSSKNKGIGGLSSGLDTDSLIEALTSGTVAKITKQNQQRQLLLWKQTSYRTFATAMQAYQDKYLRASSSSSAATNLSSNSFFNTYKTTASSSKVSVSAGSGASVGSFKIDSIQQLATAESITNKNSLSTKLDSSVKFTQDGIITYDSQGNPSAPQPITADTLKGKTLKLEVNGTTTTFKLDDALNGALDGDGKLNLAKFEENLQNIVNKTYGTKNVWNDEADARDKDGNLTGEKGAYETKNIVDIKFVGNDTDGFTLNIDSDEKRIYIAENNSVLGLTSGQTNRVSTKTTLGEIDAFKNNLVGDVFKFNINGVEITASKDDTLDKLMTRINSSGANVTMSYSAYTDTFTMTSKAYGAGENIVMRDTQGNLLNTIFGAQSGNSVGTSTLKTTSVPVGNELSSADIKNMAKNLGNMEFSLTINGVTKTVKADTSGLDSTDLKNGNVSAVDIINSLNKGIQNAFGKDTSVKFEDVGNGTKVQIALVSSNSDDAYSAKASTTNSSYNAMSLLRFDGGVAGNTFLDLKYSQSITVANPVTGLTLDKEKNESGVFDMTINGVTKQISISDVKDDTDLAKKLNAAITSAFGKDIASKVSFKNEDPIDNGDGTTSRKLSFNITDTNMYVSLSQSESINGKQVDIFDKLGFTETVSNDNPTAVGGTTFGDLVGSGTTEAPLNGKLTILGESESVTITYGAGTTLQDFMSQINDVFGAGAAKIVNGQLVIGNNEDTISMSDTGNLLKNMFGIDNIDNDVDSDTYGKNVYSTTNASYNEGQRKEGTNAEIVVEGRVITEKTNTFNINGVNVTINAVSEKDDAPITVGVESNPDEVIKNLKSWVEDYNALIISFNTAINEKTVSGYPPLTDEQKSAMTEAQIKTWETEAKKGLLRNDATLRGIVNELRDAMYEKVEAAGISIFDIGITTTKYTDATTAGTLQIDEDKLRKMLESDPDKVRLLFVGTSTEDGLTARMNKIVEKAAKTSSIDRGSLISLAGTEISTGDNTSIIGKKLSTIDDYIKRLQSRLETEYNRYWKKFSSLETAIQKMSSQSSMFSAS